jgi:hypothetical protein
LKEFDEGGILVLGFREINAACDAIGNGSNRTSCFVGGFETIERILDDEAFFGRKVHAPHGFEVEIWRGFDAGGVFASDDVGEVREKPEFLEPAIDPVVGGTGDNGAGEGYIPAVFESVTDTGHGVEFGNFFADPLVADPADGLPFEGLAGEFFETGFGRPGFEVGADALDILLERKIVSVLEEDIADGFVDGPFGVENDTVEVEENGSGFHGEEVAAKAGIAMLTSIRMRVQSEFRAIRFERLRVWDFR